MKNGELEKSKKKKKDEENSENQDGSSRSEDEDDEESDDGNKKWEYLEHKGVSFHQPYRPCGVKPTYEGEPFELLPEEQELLYYWYQSKNAAQITNPTFKSNFLREFMVRFRNKKFENFSFTEIYQRFDSDKEQKNANEALKNENKNKKIEEEKHFGYAVVDNLLQKLSGFKIEGPSLLKGRGEHPLTGTLKARIYPEDVTINIGEKAPIPVCPMKGHCWGSIVHNHEVTWLASFKDPALKKSHKYVYLAANSVFKSSNDIKKYEKARVLKSKINDIRKDYYEKLNSSDAKQRQLGTATYLIDTLALRVGNEKSKDEADTVGCCSLRVEHMTVDGNNKITLNFLGKDSIEYKNTVAVEPIVYKNLESFLKMKEPKDDIFDKIDAQVLNDYLRGLMEGLTAKVFRTYNASSTLQQQLNKRDLTGLTMEQKKDKYDEANTQVAILCNHQRTISKKAEQNSKKAENDLKTKAQYVDDLKAHFEQFKGKKKPTRKSQTIKLESGKDYNLEFPDSKEQTELLLNKQRQRLEKEQRNFDKKERNKQVATGTSKTNYNDPRISVAWCKKNEVKIEKVFNKALLSKFFWAMSIESTYEF